MTLTKIARRDSRPHGRLPSISLDQDTEAEGVQPIDVRAIPEESSLQLFGGSPVGQLARQAGLDLPLKVLPSTSGYYLGTADDDGPFSRESVEYWPSEEAAQRALAGQAGKAWTQRLAP